MNRWFALVVCFLLLSCGKEGEQFFTHHLDNSWEKNDKQVFQFEINDAEIAKNIIFVIKNNEEYPYSNLWLISSLNGAEPDTLNYLLAKPNGEWIGTGLGSAKETMFQYKLNYKFPKNGIYKIEVQQAMRKDTLKGIDDFGIKIEQVQP